MTNTNPWGKIPQENLENAKDDMMIEMMADIVLLSMEMGLCTLAKHKETGVWYLFTRSSDACSGDACKVDQRLIDYMLKNACLIQEENVG